MLFEDGLHDRQADAHSALLTDKGALDLAEFGQYLRDILRRNADPGIADR